MLKGSSNDARIMGVMAASGSGKGVFLKGELRRENPARLVIYDYKDEYGEFSPVLVHSIDQVRKAMIKANAGPLRIRYKSRTGTKAKQVIAEFEALCRLVQQWGNCTFLAEEISNVTMPGWAPPAWREMTTGGRHEKVYIIGVAQNPALIDKTFLSNCTVIHVGPLRQHAHRKAVANSMDIDIKKLNALVKFQYIQRNAETGEVIEGWVESNDKSLQSVIDQAKRQHGAAATPTGPSPTPRGEAKPCDVEKVPRTSRHLNPHQRKDHP